MLRITVESVPFGEEDDASIIEQLTIANVGGDDRKANYEFAISDQGETFYGRVGGFMRRDGAWELVEKCLVFAHTDTSPQTDTQTRLAGYFK